MNTLTRIAGFGLLALLASTTLTSAAPMINPPVVIDVDTYDPPVDVDTYEPPIDIYQAPIDDHDLSDAFDEDGPIDDHDLSDAFDEDGPIDDHDLSDAFDDEDDKDVADAGLLLTCKIVGGDLVITNAGGAIPAGTKVKWHADGRSGTVMLPNGLTAGQKAKIDLNLGVETGKCTADVVL